MTEIREYCARGILRPDGSVQRGGALQVEGGRVARAVTRAATDAVDLGDVLLTPTFVNAHCHLELSGFAGALPRDAGFGAWVRALMRLREAASPNELKQAARRGARRLMETGCALVHDIDTTGAGAQALLEESIDAVVYREAIDAGDAARRAQCLADLERPIGLRAQLTEGISPHAPYTCSSDLLRGLADLARRRNLPLTMHWAETLDEVRYLRDGDGPLADILPPSPRKSGLELIEEAGLLAPDLTLTLVHGNHPEPGDYARLAAADVALVHCPGTHAFFDRGPFDARAALQAGVRLLLGTDSLASNDDLNLAAELRGLLETGALDFDQAWTAATAGGELPGSVRISAWEYEGEQRSLEDLVREGASPQVLDFSSHAGAPRTRYSVDP